jgi:hypothetical protein
MVSQQALEELKEIYREEYGVNLSDDELAEKAKLLLLLFKLTYRPIQK